MRGGRDHLCSIGVEPPQSAACSCPSNADTLCNTSAPHPPVGSSSGIGAHFQMVGVRRYGWRRSSRLLVACAGPSNRVVLPSTHCATRALKSVRARALARARRRRRLSQAHPFSSSDAPRESTRDVQRRTTNGIVHAGSTLFTSAQTLSPCISPPKWSEPSRHQPAATSTVGCPPVHRLKPGLYMP